MAKQQDTPRIADVENNVGFSKRRIVFRDVVESPLTISWPMLTNCDELVLISQIRNFLNSLKDMKVRNKKIYLPSEIASEDLNQNSSSRAVLTNSGIFSIENDKITKTVKSVPSVLLKRYFISGINKVSKYLEECVASRAKDSAVLVFCRHISQPSSLVEHLPILAKLSNVPAICLGSVHSADVASWFGLNRMICFIIRDRTIENCNDFEDRYNDIVNHLVRDTLSSLIEKCPKIELPWLPVMTLLNDNSDHNVKKNDTNESVCKLIPLKVKSIDCSQQRSMVAKSRRRQEYRKFSKRKKDISDSYPVRK